MRVLLAFLIASLVGLLGGTPSAQAAELCNRTSYVIEVATGWPVEGGVAIRGWDRIRPGACAELADDAELAGDQPLFYYAKTSEAYLGGVREWRGNVPLCVDEVDFDVVANTRCAALGLASRDFMIREGEERLRTVLVEPSNYLLAPSTPTTRRSSQPFADAAGIQRLLNSAGYPIANIDGFEGPGTRRAITSFLSDVGISSRPGNAELLDRLEAYAVERNATSGVTLCNDSIGDISAVIGYRVDNIWQSRGWWRLYAGDCARLLSAHLETANTYFYAERINTGERLPITEGVQEFCIAPARFVSEGRDNCAQRGYGVARFRSIPEPENGGVRIHVQDSDFGSPDRLTP